jgi:hypothetical protein
MDQFATQFFTTPTLAFVVGISVLVLTIRKIVEKAWTAGAVNLWWGDVILPTLPIILAVLIAGLAKQYPFPPVFAASLSARLFFGLVCGAFADLIYMKVKKLISAFAGVDDPAPTLVKP